MTPRPGAAPAAIAGKPFALRAQAFPSTAAALLSAGRSDNINTNNKRREVGPLQTSAVGPVQTATPSNGGPYRCARHDQQLGGASPPWRR